MSLVTNHQIAFSRCKQLGKTSLNFVAHNQSRRIPYARSKIKTKQADFVEIDTPEWKRRRCEGKGGRITGREMKNQSLPPPSCSLSRTFQRYFETKKKRNFTIQEKKDKDKGGKKERKRDYPTVHPLLDQIFRLSFLVTRNNNRLQSSSSEPLLNLLQIVPTWVTRC